MTNDDEAIAAVERVGRDTPSAELAAAVAVAAQALIEACVAHGVMLATAESCTGGLIAGALTDVAGASRAFDRGWVTYSNGAKHAELEVDPRVIERTGAVSAEVAGLMAQGAVRVGGVGLALAVTGVAGPSASEAKPVGLVYFGAATRDGVFGLKQEFGPLSRPEIRQRSVLTALALGLRALEGGA